jgi:hypothetical protein
MRDLNECNFCLSFQTKQAKMSEMRQDEKLKEERKAFAEGKKL